VAQRKAPTLAATLRPKTMREKQMLDKAAMDLLSPPPIPNSSRSLTCSTPKNSAVPVPKFQPSPVLGRKRKLSYGTSSAPGKDISAESSFEVPSSANDYYDPTWTPHNQSRCVISEEDKSYREEEEDQHLEILEEDFDPADDNSLLFVSMKQVKDALKKCKKCGADNHIIERKKTGAYFNFVTKCTNGHLDNWPSHHEINNKQPAINILVASVLLLTGLKFAPMTRFAKLLNLSFIGKSTYYRIIDSFAKPVLCDTWFKMRKNTLEEMRVAETPAETSGDARFDSRGKGNAKFGVWSLMCCKTKKIIDFAIMQKGLIAGELESKAMLLVFSRVVEAVGLNQIKALVTDRNYTVGKKMKDYFPSIYHAFDVSFSMIFVFLYIFIYQKVFNSYKLNL